jgi:hypothetical protein
VKPDKAEADRLWQEVASKKRKSRYQLILTSNPPDSENIQIIKQYKLSFLAHLDLNAVLTYPLAAAPGKKLRNKVSVTVYNEGNIPAGNFFIEIVLSADKEIPMKPGLYSRQYQDDVLLKGGRLMAYPLKPGHSVTYTFDGAMTIPIDTPEGRYHLGLVLDPDNLIPESDEANNRLSRMIIITGNPEKVLADMDKKPVVIPAKNRLPQ